jgi:hypothetical protein
MCRIRMSYPPKFYIQVEELVKESLVQMCYLETVLTGGLTLLQNKPPHLDTLRRSALVNRQQESRRW